MKTEPAVLVGIASAVISVAVSFGLHLSTEQVGAIMALVSAVAALVVRAHVTPSA